MKTQEKGIIAELEFAIEMIKMGYTVLKPVMEGTRYDYVIDINGRFIKVQVKHSNIEKNGIIRVDIRKCRNGKYKFYTKNEIDVLGIFEPKNRKCYIIPLEKIPPAGILYLRVLPTKNKRIKMKINWAKDFEVKNNKLFLKEQ
jgi:hypothetical protein